MAPAKSRRRSRTAHKPLKPLTTDHFRKYAKLMVLDGGGHWEVASYFLEVTDEIFKGTAEVWLDVPEGNAKTTNMAGFALYHADYTPAASVPIAAASRDQTMWLYLQAAGFVHRTPGLARRFKLLEGHRRIVALRTGGRIQVWSADDRTGDGAIGTLFLLEELHRHPSLRLYRTWQGKLIKGGQLVAISTPGEPGSEYEEAKAAIIRAARMTRKNAHTVARTTDLVLHHYGMRQGEDIENLDLVKSANPFPGITKAKLKRKRDSPTRVDSHYMRFTCGIATQSSAAAITPEEWSDLRKTKIRRGVSVWAGCDLGWKWDTTAISPLWLPAASGEIKIIDDETGEERTIAKQRRVFGVPEVVVPPRNGSSTPPGKIRAAFRRVYRRNPIHTVVIDPNAGGEQLIEWIQKPWDPEADDESDEYGLGAEVRTYSQTNEPQALAYEQWMEGMRYGLLEHPHDPTFNQHVLNAIAKPVLGKRFRFDRPATTRSSGSGRGEGQDRRVIDALDAASNVHVVALADLTDDTPPFNPDDYRIAVL